MAIMTKTDAQEYMQNQSKPVKAAFNRYMYAVIILAFGLIGLQGWIKNADILGSLSHKLNVHSGDGTVYFISFSPDDMGWILCGIVTATIYLMQKVLLVVAGEYRANVEEFYRLSSKASWLLNKSYRKYAYFVLIVSLLMLVPAVNTYTRVAGKGIYINQFLGSNEKYYSWVDIRTVNSGFNNEDSKKPSIYTVNITFSDGAEWKMDSSKYMPVSEIQNIVHYIEEQRKTGNRDRKLPVVLPAPTS
jgi:hypothetical protein